MKIVVTGGAGFIGSNYIQLLLFKYPRYKIVCVDALTYAGDLYNLKNAIANSNFTFIKADITDKQAIEEVFATELPDVVVNFAAETHVDRSIVEPELFLRTNVMGTGILLDMCRKYGSKRFHQVSTDEVYGDLPIESKLLFDEQASIKPNNPYAASKASADLLVLAYYKTFGIHVTISRCTNNYGPCQFSEKLIPVIISNALAGRSIPIYGTGNNVRDWLYVDDHCMAIDLIVHKGISGEVYNIAANNDLNNLAVAGIVLQELKIGDELITLVADRLGHDRRYALDASKIKRQLGWKPCTSFIEGIKKTIQWYLENQSRLSLIAKDCNF